MSQIIYSNSSYFNPYCFSPTSETVYFPPWRNWISHDIPFSDGLSGTIEATFEAHTPIIVKEGKSGQLSVNINGKYFIPGTSIKGMVRNVFEILSLSRMGPLVKDNRYSLRDLDPNNKDYTLKTRTPSILAGLMVKIDDSYFLVECPKYEKLSYDRIAEFEKVSPNKLKEAKTVEAKYKLIEGDPIYNDGQNDFVLFFTGPMNNKENEYKFQIPTSLKFIPLEDTINDFLFIHEHEVKSKSWLYWKSRIRNFNKAPTYDDLTNEICYAPVFYTKKGPKIESLGLAFLHRELYKHSVHDFIGDEHISNEADLTQCVFGSAKEGLKGRVQFSAAFVDMRNRMVDEKPVEIILGTPKPTFYPFYLTQNPKLDRASTFSDDNGKINGWKRYLVHQKTMEQAFTNENKSVRTLIRPLPAGVTFTSKIRFHNLKPQELGALLSALTFHNNFKKCFHQIGMAKPLGYGKLELTRIELTDNGGNLLAVEPFMAQYEQEMCKTYAAGSFDQWAKDVSPLFGIATGNYTKPIHYPADFSQFKAIKRERKTIADFSPNLKEFKMESLQNKS